MRELQLIARVVFFGSLPLVCHSLAPPPLPPSLLDTSLLTSAAATAAASSASFLHNPLAVYMDTLAAHPLPTKMVTGATLAVCGDAIAQSREIEYAYDKTRAASFAAFDMCYRALQHVAFPIIVAECQGQYLSALLPPQADTSIAAAIEQTLASQLGIVPFLYYPVFFALTGAVQQLTPQAALDRARQNFLPLMERNLLFWIPIQFIQFMFVQEDLQIPFLSVCGLCWTFILSVMAGSTKEFKEEEEEQPYCVTGMEGECILPDELFPQTTPEAIGLELQHELEDVIHAIEDVSHDLMTLPLEHEEEESTDDPGALEEESEEKMMVTK